MSTENSPSKQAIASWLEENARPIPSLPSDSVDFRNLPREVHDIVIGFLCPPYLSVFANTFTCGQTIDRLLQPRNSDDWRDLMRLRLVCKLLKEEVNSDVDLATRNGTSVLDINLIDNANLTTSRAYIDSPGPPHDSSFDAFIDKFQHMRTTLSLLSGMRVDNDYTLWNDARGMDFTYERSEFDEAMLCVIRLTYQRSQEKFGNGNITSWQFQKSKSKWKTLAVTEFMQEEPARAAIESMIATAAVEISANQNTNPSAKAQTSVDTLWMLQFRLLTLPQDQAENARTNGDVQWRMKGFEVAASMTRGDPLSLRHGPGERWQSSMKSGYDDEDWWRVWQVEGAFDSDDRILDESDDEEDGNTSIFSSEDVSFDEDELDRIGMLTGNVAFCASSDSDQDNAEEESEPDEEDDSEDDVRGVKRLDGDIYD